MTTQRLKAKLAESRVDGQLSKVHRSLRQQVVDYAVSKRTDGQPVNTTAQELGVGSSTLRAWMKSSRGGEKRVPSREAEAHQAAVVGFSQLVVRPTQATERVGLVELEFADGTRLRARQVPLEMMSKLVDELRQSR